MNEITRAGFVKSSAKAVAGVTVIGALASQSAEADAGRFGTEPVVAYVKNPRSGEISLMSGEREVIVRDRALAAKIDRAAR